MQIDTIVISVFNYDIIIQNCVVYNSLYIGIDAT